LIKINWGVVHTVSDVTKGNGYVYHSIPFPAVLKSNVAKAGGFFDRRHKSQGYFGTFV